MPPSSIVSSSIYATHGTSHIHFAPLFISRPSPSRLILCILENLMTAKGSFNFLFSCYKLDFVWKFVLTPCSSSSSPQKYFQIIVEIDVTSDNWYYKTKVNVLLMNIKSKYFSDAAREYKNRENQHWGVNICDFKAYIYCQCDV